MLEQLHFPELPRPTFLIPELLHFTRARGSEDARISPSTWASYVHFVKTWTATFSRGRGAKDAELPHLHELPKPSLQKPQMPKLPYLSELSEHILSKPELPCLPELEVLKIPELSRYPELPKSTLSKPELSALPEQRCRSCRDCLIFLSFLNPLYQNMNSHHCQSWWTRWLSYPISLIFQRTLCLLFPRMHTSLPNSRLIQPLLEFSCSYSLI